MDLLGACLSLREADVGSMGRRSSPLYKNLASRLGRLDGRAV